jgi:Siphovirus ReqiPepy6 Gp37-like protein
MVFNSSKKTSAEISAEGYAELNKRPHVESFTAEIIHNPNTISTYGVDWFLGDVVTIQSSDLLVSVNAQITQVDETYENGEYTLEATFGEAKLNFVQLVKNSIK